MKMQKNLYSAFSAALLLFSLSLTVPAGHAKSHTIAPDDWPKRLDKRKLYTSECGFVYAGSNLRWEKLTRYSRQLSAKMWILAPRHWQVHR